MARRGFQQGSLFRRGTRKKVWVARWWEDVIHTDGTLGRLRRSEVIGTCADFPTRRRAMQVLSQRLGSINSGKTRPQSIRTFGDFAKDDWMPVVLPTLKYATQKHYKYMLDVHLETVLTPIHVRNLAAGLNEPARSITLLLVLTGLRVGELLALRWGRIDLNARLLRVVETVYDGHFDQPKTKRSARTIPIGTETAVILAGICPAAVDPKALVFATREGLPLDRWNLLRKHLKPAAKKLGLPGVTWHLLRHSHATMLDSVGTPIGTMQSLLAGC